MSCLLPSFSSHQPPSPPLPQPEAWLHSGGEGPVVVCDVIATDSRQSSALLEWWITRHSGVTPHHTDAVSVSERRQISRRIRLCLRFTATTSDRYNKSWYLVRFSTLKFSKLFTIFVLFLSQLYHDAKSTKISYTNQTNLITSLSDVFSLSSLYIKGKTNSLIDRLNNPCSAVVFVLQSNVLLFTKCADYLKVILQRN